MGSSGGHGFGTHHVCPCTDCEALFHDVLWDVCAPLGRLLQKELMLGMTPRNLRSPDPIAQNRRTRFCGASSSRLCSATWTMESTILRSRSCLCKTDSCLVLFKTLPTTLPTYTTLVWCWRQSVTHIIATKQGCSPTPQVQWVVNWLNSATYTGKMAKCTPLWLSSERWGGLFLRPLLSELGFGGLFAKRSGRCEAERTSESQVWGSHKRNEPSRSSKGVMLWWLLMTSDNFIS